MVLILADRQDGNGWMIKKMGCRGERLVRMGSWRLGFHLGGRIEMELGSGLVVVLPSEMGMKFAGHGVERRWGSLKMKIGGGDRVHLEI